MVPFNVSNGSIQFLLCFTCFISVVQLFISFYIFYILLLVLHAFTFVNSCSHVFIWCYSFAVLYVLYSFVCFVSLPGVQIVCSFFNGVLHIVQHRCSFCYNIVIAVLLIVYMYLQFVQLLMVFYTLLCLRIAFHCVFYLFISLYVFTCFYMCLGVL